MLDEGVAGRMPARGRWTRLWVPVDGGSGMAPIWSGGYWDLFPSPAEELWCKSGESSLCRAVLTPRRSAASRVSLWKEWQMIRGCC